MPGKFPENVRDIYGNWREYKVFGHKKGRTHRHVGRERAGNECIRSINNQTGTLGYRYTETGIDLFDKSFLELISHNSHHSC